MYAKTKRNELSEQEYKGLSSPEQIKIPVIVPESIVEYNVVIKNMAKLAEAGILISMPKALYARIKVASGKQ